MQGDDHLQSPFIRSLACSILLILKVEVGPLHVSGVWAEANIQIFACLQLPQTARVRPLWVRSSLRV